MGAQGIPEPDRRYILLMPLVHQSAVIAVDISGLCEKAGKRNNQRRMVFHKEDNVYFLFLYKAYK